MPSWFFGLFLAAVWCLWVVAAASQREVADDRRGVPASERGGVSVFPAIPLFPIAFWGMAWLIDRFVPPWGSRILITMHGLFAVGLLISLDNDWRYRRSSALANSPDHGLAHRRGIDNDRI